MGWQKKRNITQDYEVKCVKENPNGLQGSHTMTISVLNNNANKVIQLTKQMEGAITNILPIVKNNESDICRVTILSPNLLNVAGPGYVQH